MEETENTATTEETTEPATENGAETAAEQPTETSQPETPQPEAVEEEISYHAVEKEGNVTAIWEMQGRKHLRTIDPRSVEGKHILSLFTSEHHEEAA